MKKLNQQLRDERKLRGWSQEQSAEALARLCMDDPRARGEIGSKMISRWETGEHTPSPYYQQKLCALFGKTALELGFVDGYNELTPMAGQPLSIIEARVVIGTLKLLHQEVQSLRRQLEGHIKQEHEAESFITSVAETVADLALLSGQRTEERAAALAQFLLREG